MHWQKAVELSPSDAAIRHDGHRRIIRYHDGTGHVWHASNRTRVWEAGREQLEGFTDWQPVDLERTGGNRVAP